MVRGCQEKKPPKVVGFGRYGRSPKFGHVGLVGMQTYFWKFTVGIVVGLVG